MAIRKVMDMLRVSTALGELQTARLYMLKAIAGLERDREGDPRTDGMVARMEGVIREMDDMGKELTQESFETVGIDIEEAIRETVAKSHK